MADETIRVRVTGELPPGFEETQAAIEKRRNVLFEGFRRAAAIGA